MMQEIDVKGRILNILYPIWRRITLVSARMKKKKTMSMADVVRARPFAFLALGLAVMTLVLVVQLPRVMGKIDRQGETLLKVMGEYSELQAERNVVNSELARIDDRDYIETIARRVHGYGWYGETIYEVGNLDEILEAQAGSGL